MVLRLWGFPGRGQGAVNKSFPLIASHLLSWGAGKFDVVSLGPWEQKRLSGPSRACTCPWYTCPCFSFIHSFFHSFIHPFFHSFIHTFIHSFIHSSIHPSIHASIPPTLFGNSCCVCSVMLSSVPAESCPEKLMVRWFPVFAGHSAHLGRGSRRTWNRSPRDSGV